jgi:RNA polymerase sigma factor (sigma-70 family)
MSVAPRIAKSPRPVARETERLRRERFEQVFDAHFRAVSAYALRRASPAEAEDAVAETFLVAWRRLDDMPGNAKAWLLGVTRRVLANQRRAAGRREALTKRVAHEREREPDLSRQSPILLALQRLSESDQEVLLLFAWDGLSTHEVATTLGCSRTAVKVRLHRARRRLRTELQRLERGRAVPVVTTRRLEECHEE